MQYFIFLLLLVHLLCSFSNGRECQSNNLQEENEKLKEQIVRIKDHESWLSHYYKSQIKTFQEQILLLEENINRLKIQNDLDKRIPDKQKFIQLIEGNKQFEIELWGQIIQDEDYSCFILIHLNNQIVIKITCKNKKCDSEKRYLYNAVQEGVSAQIIDKGQLKETQIKMALQLIYSDLYTSMSNQEYIKYIFKELKKQ